MLAPLFAATALALPGGVLADTANGAETRSPDEAPAQASPNAPRGFVLLQRNIYVPIDANGKAASSNWIVIDKQGFVTAEELQAEQPEDGATGQDGGSNGDGSDSQAAPKTEDSAPPAPRTAPSVNGGSPIGRGPMIAS